MPNEKPKHTYRSTETKYKGKAKQMFVTYDLVQKTRGDHQATFPKVKRVYVAGDVSNWEVGEFEKQSGRKVHGVKIEYAQSRAGYDRRGYKAERQDTGTSYTVRPTHVNSSVSSFRKIVEIPASARHVQLHTKGLPHTYESAQQSVR